MANSGPDWAAYLSGIAAFAGTLFALVLAARQIRGPVDSSSAPDISRAYLVDSIAVTVELGAAALLAILVPVEESLLFCVAVGLIVVVGFGLALASGAAWAIAISRGDVQGRRSRVVALAQGIGNVLPLACYAIAGLYALRVLHYNSAAWGYAAAASWLTFSGTVQAVLWYARLWERPGVSARSPSP